MEISISFIIACHGSVVSNFHDIEFDDLHEEKDGNSKSGSWVQLDDIPSNEKFTVVSSESKKFGELIETENKVVYGNKPLLIFDYTELDTSQLNVLLHTRDTCIGIPKFVLPSAITSVINPSSESGFVNQTIHEITSLCPVELFEEYGNVKRITHKKYKQPKGKKTRLKVLKLLKKVKPKKLQLMTYENEKVDNMMNKNFGVSTDDSDEYKLVMVTSIGCEIEEYTLLSSNIDEIKDSLYRLAANISQIIARKILRLLTFEKKSISTTLAVLLNIGCLIIKELNGDVRQTPIVIYERTCNNFNNLQKEYENIGKNGLDSRELSIIKLIDGYLRKKDVAYGGKN